MHKRLLVGLAAAGIVGGATFGFAASLGTVDSDNLGAGNSVVASCDGDGMDVSYSTAYNADGGDSSQGGYDVTSVDLSGVAAACDGQEITVTLSGASDASLEEEIVTLDVVTGAASVDVDDVNAELVEGVHIVIAGASA